MAVLPVGIGPETSYNISRSLRFNSADSAYLNRTPASAGSTTIWTYSVWVKYSVSDNGVFNQPIFWASGNSVNGGLSIAQSPNTPHRFYVYNGGFNIETTQVFRDPSAWYHIVAVIDNTQATASNRTKLYVNGVQVTAFAAASYPAQNAASGVNNTTEHNIGKQIGQSRFFSGYLTEVNFIDGQALTPSSFGETDPITGVWKPKKYTGTYGTNGFYLNFSDNSGTTATTLGKDYSGNGNNWTPNNFSVTAGAGNDSMVDVPTLWGSDTGAGGEVRGNYCTLNPLQQTSTASITDGNLRLAAGATAWGVSLGTIGISSGKWYWEVTTLNDIHPQIGIGTSSTLLTDYVGRTSASYAYRADDGFKVTNGSGSSYGASYTTNDIIGVALNMDAGTVVFYKNGVSQGTAFSGLTGEFFPAVSTYNSKVLIANFGQRAFAYAPPANHKALVTTNLPEPTIKQGDDYFNVVLYTGTGSARSVTGVGFQPDFVWAKGRSNADPNYLHDAVRTVAYRLNSAITDGEYAGLLSSFDSDGFSINSSGGGMNGLNNTFVAWNWKAGGTGVTNTAGSITSTVSANTTAGFSIVTYTGNGTNGATVGHGLGVAPVMIVTKKRNAASNWYVWHQRLSGANYGLSLNTTDAELAFTFGTWGTKTSTVITASQGTNGLTNVNATNDTYVAYCFAEVPGYSAFGSYTGNGSADGPFVFTGFRPRYLLIKQTNTTNNWIVVDTARSSYNEASQWLYPDLSVAEESGAGRYWDALSNGFKIRNAGTGMNTSGGTYIYAAFAENPFKYSLAR